MVPVATHSDQPERGESPTRGAYDPAMEHAQAAGRLLAERHQDQRVEPDPAVSLVNYAEAPRPGDWTLRSSLVRLAQPEPALVAALLEQVRRLDTTLHHAQRALGKYTVLCDRTLTRHAVSGSASGWALAHPAEPYVDCRVADIARMAKSFGDDGASVVDAYLAEIDLRAEERGSIALLEVALDFDELAIALAEWAPTAPAPAPAEHLAAVTDRARARMNKLGVPIEEGPPPGRGRRTR